MCDDLLLQRQVAAALDRALLGTAAGSEEQPPSWYCLNAANLDWVATLMAEPPPGVPGPAYRQILGVEQFTYQSSDQQYQFLAALRQLANQQTDWPCSFLLWLPQPWLQQVRHSAPELYRRCDRVFKFLGDPRPLPTATLASNQFTAVELGPWIGIQPPDQRSDQPAERPAIEAVEPEVSSEDVLIAPLDSANPALKDSEPQLLTQAHRLSPELWHRLTTDLSQLEQSSAAKTSAGPIPSSDQDIETQAQGAHAQTGAPTVAPTTQEQSSNIWGEAHRLRDQVEAGDHRIPLLQAAIAEYETILKNKQVADAQHAEGLNDLGSLYWMWAQQVSDLESRQRHLQHSIQLYESALALKVSPLKVDTLMRIHSNLGSVHCLQATHCQPEHHLSQAIGAFHRALQYVDPVQEQALYVTVQTHLGTAYWSLSQQTHTPDYLHQAIAAYHEALQHCSAHDALGQYGQIQNNLGITYWSLAQYEQPLPLLEQAITAYHKALTYRTLAIDPIGHGATQNNLGTAHWDLGRQYSQGDARQRQAWQQAIAAYEAALQLSPEQAAQGFDRWATHHSLGVVYEQLALQNVSTPQPEPFQIAINHYIQAMSGWQTEQATLVQTAFQSILNNLRYQAEHLGITAQQKSLAHIPAALLPEIWRHL
ncbi:MAG: hypothetical protein ACFB0C_21120 [Leptolyngbyaceae cyanobacterium]